MAAITQTGIVPFGQGHAPENLVQRVVQAVFDEGPIQPHQIDMVVVANAAAEGLCGLANIATWTTTQAGLVDTPALRVETGPSSGLAALAAARALVDGGHATNVLLLGWEVMTQVDTAQATSVLAKLMAQDEQAIGLSLPGLVAMLTSAYVARHGLTEQALARIPVKAHAMATANPIAQFRDPVEVDEVLGSRMIADPLRLYHCAPLTDGAGALVLAPDGPVEIEAMGHATDHLGYTQRRGPPDGFQATAVAARRAFRASDLSRSAIDVAEVHDAFSPLEAIHMEDLGYADPGHGIHALSLDDPLAGEPVVNPSGGLKARGHPVGATGVAQLIEGFEQLTGQAANQVDQAQAALIHSIGGFGNNVHVSLLEASA